MYPKDSKSEWHRGQGLWSHVPESDWNNWAWQLKNRINSPEKLEKLIELTPEEKEGCNYAKHKLALSITPYFFNLIDREDPNCPIRKQIIPRENEIHVSPEELLDPVGEENTMPVEGLVHRYPDRVLFLVTSQCASYCRYCTRSRLVSNAQDYNFRPRYEKALNYIREHTEVRDVLLSGGDPLLLNDRRLDFLLGELRSIPHVEFIRIGSRVPVFLPQRITDSLCDVFRKHGPIWLSIHVNHPKECTHDLFDATQKLSYAGVPIGNQSVLLNGVNDNLETMKSLIHRLLMMRVRPYYLYQCDLITGSAHLRTSVMKGIEIIKGLRGHTSGYSVPQYVIDAPGGGGKIPINPEYIEEINDKEIVLKNYEGKIYKYPIKPSGQNAPLPVEGELVLS